MKKLLFKSIAISAILYGINTNVNAQNWLVGGNASSQNDSIGAKTNFGLNIITNNATRIFIKKTGQVGIGTSNPVTKLHVNGTTGASLSSDGIMIMGDKAAFNIVYDGQDIQARNNSAGATCAYQNFYGGNLQIGTNTNRLLYDATSGNFGVGIGLSTPSQKLHVVGNIRNDGNLFVDGSAVNNGTIANTIQFGGPSGEAIGSRRTAGSNQYGLDFYTGSLNRMSITNGGSVGIGTKDPTSKFHLLGLESTAHGKNAAIEISNTASLGANWYLRAGANGTATPVKGFSIADDNGYRLVIDSVGFIGVGTTTPTFYFDVEGAITGPMAGAGIIHAKVNAQGMQDRIAIKAESQPSIGHGIGVEATGGFIGVKGYSSNSNSPNGYYGGFFSADGAGPEERIGVFGSAYGGSGYNWGVFSSGSAYTTSAWLSSDARFKKDVQLLENSIDKIMKLKPSSYFFKTEEYGFMNLPDEKQDGFLAQDLEKVFPEMVKEIGQPLIDDKGNPTGKYFIFKGINYNEMIPVLVAGLQEEHTNTTMKIQQLEEENAALKSTIEDMQQCMEILCNQNATPFKSEQKFIKQEENILYLNQPNPFNQNTIIKYQLAGNVSSASIIIRDLNGSLLKSISLNGKGKKQVVINANEFVQGTYTYSLIVNDETIDTKIMVITK